MLGNDLNEIKKNCDAKMKKSIDHLMDEFKAVRTGRANISILDSVNVDYYGEKMKINQLANMTVPDPHTIAIDPWDKSSLLLIVKAIETANLGLNPVNDGKILRVPIPALTEERRKEIIKNIKKKGEDSKVALRNLRRDANEHIKKLEKDGHMSEDLVKKTTDEVQKLTDKYIKDIDGLVVKKEKELLEV